ncbi:MAG: hypothetical protein ABJ327_26275 [Litoreibacter sp.]
MKRAFAIVTAVALTACAAPIPDSGTKGVGFESYESYLARQRAREIALRTGRPVPLDPSVAADPRTSTVAVAVPQTPEQQTADAAVAAVRGTQPSTTQTYAATTTRAPTQPSADNPDLSDEQDFDAVSGRQSIESDAQRRAAQSAQYQVIAPTALPSRPRSNGAPTPIEFAVATSHPIGQQVYRRSPFGSRKTAEACARYTSGEAAQQAFLNSGGPNRDKLSLDPDGDGYACRWDPNLYRTARTN